jgi:hypothetical protein
VIGVDFQPSSKLGGAASVALAENIALTTNSLNVAGSIENIPVTGVELLPLPVLMLTASPKPVVFGKTLTITLDAGASSGGVAPTGMVTFFSNGIKIGSANLGPPPGRSTGGSSSATIQTSTLKAGAYNLTATYPGDAAYGPAISNQVFLLVNQATPGLSFSPPPPTNVTLGSQVPLAVAFSNTVTNTPPKGTVTFTDGGTTIKTVDVIAGAASFTTPAMRVGSHTWMATYSGDDNYLSSSTPALTVGVGRIGPSITLTASVATNRGGTSFYATASLTSPAGTVPTLTLQSGTITFYENGVSVGTFTLPVTAPIAVGPLHLARGAYQIEAIYSGDSNYLPATSNVVTLTVP